MAGVCKTGTCWRGPVGAAVAGTRLLINEGVVVFAKAKSISVIKTLVTLCFVLPILLFKMFISSKDILQYVVWCNTVHALILEFKDDKSVFSPQADICCNK
jgi:hypothetical protein